MLTRSHARKILNRRISPSSPDSATQRNVEGEIYWQSFSSAGPTPRCRGFLIKFQHTKRWKMSATYWFCEQSIELTRLSTVYPLSLRDIIFLLVRENEFGR
jgi:hypothetical protein